MTTERTTPKGNNGSIFISVDRCVEFFRQNFGVSLDPLKVDLLINLNILPAYKNYNDKLVLISDLKSLAKAISAMSSNSGISFLSGLLFEKEVITPCSNMRIDLAIGETETDPVFHSAAAKFDVHVTFF